MSRVFIWLEKPEWDGIKLWDSACGPFFIRPPKLTLAYAIPYKWVCVCLAVYIYLYFILVFVNNIYIIVDHTNILNTNYFTLYIQTNSYHVYQVQTDINVCIYLCMYLENYGRHLFLICYECIFFIFFLFYYLFNECKIDIFIFLKCKFVKYIFYHFFLSFFFE